MYNKYTVYVFEEHNEVKASIYAGNDCLGKVWRPKASSKHDIVSLMESVGNVIYGQENKEKKKEESYSQVLAIIEAKDKREQENLQEEE